LALLRASGFREKHRRREIRKKQKEPEMPNRTIIMSGAACALLVGAIDAGPAQAQFLTGFGGTYLRGDLGWSSAGDAELVDKDFDLDGFIQDQSGTGPGVVNDIGSGYVLGIGVGSRISELFRGEIVYSFRDGYELDDTDQFGNAFAGNINSHSVMANLYWDIPLAMAGIAPFVGAGVGWASNNMDDVVTTDGGTFFLPEGTTSNLAWQAMAGVGFAVSPQTSIDVFYRYFDGGKLQTELDTAFTSGGGSAGTYTGMRGELIAHEIVLSVRFNFGP
jgi:opacity protein-like surface antigen